MITLDRSKNGAQTHAAHQRGAIMSHQSRLPGIVVGPILLLLAVAPSAFGQTEGSRVSCLPVAERAGREFGCFIVATQAIGRPDAAHAFWHVSTLAGGSARDTAEGARSTVVEALGKR